MLPGHPPEILAPAGDLECAVAAAEAGADAVYFGLSDFNARRRAGNIGFKELPGLVQKLHGMNVKAYLALNTDISQRELAEAARYYAFAKFAGVDALIVKDLCFAEFRRHLGEIPLHLSTQAAISSSSGAKFARQLGASRVILAREMSAEEIKSAASVEGIQVEIFVQGAMCFCISGRCLLSSWIGGRSGNRGLCASPCRMEWTDADSGGKSRPMSMKDLSLLEHIREISRIGVASLKIEGRLKNAEWVANAVRTVKTIRDSHFKAVNASQLGSYAGREMTDSFYLGKTDSLVADSSRPKSAEPPGGGTEDKPANSLTVAIEEKSAGKIAVRMTLLNHESARSLSSEVMVKRRDEGSKKNLILSQELIESIGEKFKDISIEENSSFPEFLLSPSDFSRVQGTVAALLNKMSKEPKESLKFALPDELLEKIRRTVRRCEFRRGKFGFEEVRISAAQTKIFKGQEFDFKFIVECKSLAEAKSSAYALSGNFIIALPQVIYEKDIGQISSIIGFCTQNGIQLELNNLDEIPIAGELHAKWSAGPGLAVLNSFSVEVLRSHGACMATASPEADQTKLKELLDACELPLAVYVFGRPRLMQSRCGIGAGRRRISERRGLDLLVENENGFTILYPARPFRLELPGGTPAIFAADLVHSPDPAAEIRSWRSIPAGDFNFSRRLR